MAKGPEAQTQALIINYLQARGVLAYRMNTGAMRSEYKGKQRFMRFGTPGMADVLAFPPNKRIVWANYDHSKETDVCWIECKAPKGKQSELQKSFQVQVEQHGHRYILARSLEDVMEAI